MSEDEKFTKEEIIKALEFDIRQYRRKHDYHLSLTQDYLERIEDVKKKIAEIRSEIK